MNNNKRAIKAGIWYTISNFIIRGFGFITTPFFARVMTKGEYGMFSNYSTWLSLGIIVVGLNLYTTMVSAKFDYKEDIKQYMLSMVGLSTFSTIIWAVIINIFTSFFEKMLSMDISYINLMLVYFLFVPAINMFTSYESNHFKYQITIIINGILSISSIVLSIILIIMMDNNYNARVLGYILPFAIIGCCIYIMIIIQGKRFSTKYWPYALKIALPYVPHLLSIYMLSSIDKIMIVKICGKEANGLYSIACSCGYIVSIFMSSVNSAYSPWLAENINNKKYETIKRFSKRYIAIFGVVVLGMILISPEIVFILGGKKYMAAKYVMVPIILGCMCQFLYTMFVNVEQCLKKTRGMAVASAIAAIINYVLNYIFIPRYGYVAAAYTTLAGYFILLLIHMYLVHKLHYSMLYDYTYIFIVTGVIMILGIMVGVIIDYTALRYSILTIYAIAIIVGLIKNRKYIIKVIKAIVR